MYQLKRLPGPPPYGPEQVQELVWDILSSLEEHLQWRQGAAMPEGGQEWGPTRTLMPHYWDKAPQRKLRDDDSYNCDLAEAREAHWWALVVTHLLEERIERLSQSATRTRQDDWWHSHSQGHLRRWLRGCQWRCTKTPASGDHWRDSSERQTQSPSPSPTRPWKHVTFQYSESSSKESPSMRQCMGRVSQQKKGWGVWFGAPTYSGAGIRVFPGRASCCTRGRRGVWPVARAFSGELWSLVRVERPPPWHAGLVGGAGGHPSCRQSLQTYPELMSFFWDSLGEVWGPQSQQWLFFTTHSKMHW